MGGQECTYISEAIVEVCDLTGSAIMFVDEVHRVLQAKDYKKVRFDSGFLARKVFDSKIQEKK